MTIRPPMAPAPRLNTGTSRARAPQKSGGGVLSPKKALTSRAHLIAALTGGALMTLAPAVWAQSSIPPEVGYNYGELETPRITGVGGAARAIAIGNDVVFGLAAGALFTSTTFMAIQGTGAMAIIVVVAKAAPSLGSFMRRGMDQGSPGFRPIVRRAP